LTKGNAIIFLLCEKNPQTLPFPLADGNWQSKNGRCKCIC